MPRCTDALLVVHGLIPYWETLRWLFLELSCVRTCVFYHQKTDISCPPSLTRPLGLWLLQNGPWSNTTHTPQMHAINREKTALSGTPLLSPTPTHSLPPLFPLSTLHITQWIGPSVLKKIELGFCLLLTISLLLRHSEIVRRRSRVAFPTLWNRSSADLNWNGRVQESTVRGL